MGHNLLGAGHALTIYTRTRTRPEVTRLLQEGATLATSPAGVGEAAQIVITMVGNAQDAREVTAAVLHTMASGGLIIAMETIDPATRRVLAAQAEAKGVSFLDAPVSGGTGGATRGTLTIMVGGEAEVLERARPIFDVLGSNIHHCGPVGTGSIAKLSNNWIYLSSMIAVIQSARMAQRAGLDAQTTNTIWLQSTGDCVALRTRVPFPGVVPNNPVDDGYQPGYPIEHALKDLRLIKDTAAELKVPTYLMDDVILLYQRAVDQGLAKLDISALAEVLP
jgi:3-hydroxyisobutyrate dehydrogenase